VELGSCPFTYRLVILATRRLPLPLCGSALPLGRQSSSFGRSAGLGRLSFLPHHQGRRYRGPQTVSHILLVS
jgi:hypothetical protein